MAGIVPSGRLPFCARDLHLAHPGHDIGGARSCRSSSARHAVKDDPFRWNLLEDAKDVQLAEKAMESWRKRVWVDVPPLA